MSVRARRSAGGYEATSLTATAMTLPQRVAPAVSPGRRNILSTSPAWISGVDHLPRVLLEHHRLAFDDREQLPVKLQRLLLRLQRLAQHGGDVGLVVEQRPDAQRR